MKQARREILEQGYISIIIYCHTVYKRYDRFVWPGVGEGEGLSPLCPTALASIYLISADDAIEFCKIIDE